MTVYELTKTVWDIDHLVIRIYADANRKVGKFTQTYHAPHKWTLGHYVEKRIRPLIGDLDFDFVDGTGNAVAGNTLIGNILYRDAA